MLAKEIYLSKIQFSYLVYLTLEKFVIHWLFLLKIYKKKFLQKINLFIVAFLSKNSTNKLRLSKDFFLIFSLQYCLATWIKKTLNEYQNWFGKYFVERAIFSPFQV